MGVVLHGYIILNGATLGSCDASSRVIRYDRINAMPHGSSVAEDNSGLSEGIGIIVASSR